MPFEIVESCVNCWACEPLCPNRAIVEARPHFRIVAERCTECLGDHDDPQCASICPIEGAIVDECGEPLNPPGSLTGIPMAMAMSLLEKAERAGASAGSAA
ncbi:MAG: 4Fe-4S binding protein [Rhodocyclaceae bacterium]|nr:4Fe-4S binding protein [Rhodocyclaceae bacterium]